MSGTLSASQPVTPGNWVTQSINGMQYDVLLPANYDPSIKYPTMLYLHQLDMGTDPTDLLAEVNPWFNTTAFRTSTPAIIVMPLLDQTADPSGETINFGGVSTQDSTGETNAIAALKQVLSQYSTDPSRVYVTGNSLGGIGTEDMVIKYNAYTGTEGKIFAAALSLAGADYGQGYPTPSASLVSALKNVPFWAIHGGQDTTVPINWDQNLYAAEQAIGGDMKFTQDNSLGHDVWDTYYPQTGPSSPLGWLFSQSTAGSTGGPTTSPTTPAPTPSANDTVVTGTSGAITDGGGNLWTINGSGQVAVNGSADGQTANVTQLAYVSGTIWAQGTGGLWWGETQNNDSWAPAAGTATSPLPPVMTAPTPSANDTVISGATGAIIDAGGNKWTITGGGQVAFNGVADAATANVAQLAYVNGTIWQENSSKLWWGETQNNDSWAPAAGTATSPLPSNPTPPPATGVIGSGSDTIVLTMSEDADGPVGAAGRDAEFTLNVDGQQIGGLQTVTASHAAGATETFTFDGNYAPGKHVVSVTFANNSMTAGDKAAFNDGGDRNLYVNSVTYDNVAVSSTVTGIYQSPFYAPLNTGPAVYGNAVYTVNDTTVVPANAPSTPTTSPAPVSYGSGADTLNLVMSEDPYQGDAQFTVAIDGKQVGGTFTTSAIEWEGQTQAFTLHGAWGSGAHTVAVTFLNDLIGPPDAAGGYDPVDRNLVVNGIIYDGVAATTAPYVLSNDGTQSFSIAAGKPLPSTASANDTMVLAGSGNAIVDASGNRWTISSGNLVAVNGAPDTTTANVTELAYVGGKIWQENSANLWWGESGPTSAWAPAAGTSASPLPAPVSIASGTASTTVSQSEVQVVATAGTHMLFISGAGDVIGLTGGANTITDTGHGNTYMIPAAGKGTDTFTNNILGIGDTLDLKPALGATNWNGSTSTLSNYMTVTDSAQGATLAIAPTSGGTGVTIARFSGATTLTLPSLLSHAIT